MSRQLSDLDVRTFVLAGCNAAEIAAYAGVQQATATALMHKARSEIAHASFAKVVRLDDFRKRVAGDVDA